MKKYVLDLTVSDNQRLHPNYCLLKLTSSDVLPPMKAGQFVEVQVSNTPHVFLRRPISINFVDRKNNQLWLLIQLIGEGTRKMAEFSVGETVSVVLPLGNGFSVDTLPAGARPLLVGGGVGTAPMLYLGKELREKGFEPEFLLGARSAGDLMQIEQFEQIGRVHITTEDGSEGEKGFVTNHSVLERHPLPTHIFTCGPKPMMVAVAKVAAAKAIECEVSLENTMACGVGACLCCVEKDKAGHHVCVCTEGPVFNIKNLSWQI